jgi:hypothetical protein
MGVTQSLARRQAQLHLFGQASVEVGVQGGLHRSVVLIKAEGLEHQPSGFRSTPRRTPDEGYKPLAMAGKHGLWS